MPLNYASVDKNASQYAQQAQDWLLECKKIAGQLNTLYDEAVSDPERLRQMIELVQESKSNLYLAKPLQEDPLRSYPAPTLPDNYTLLSADGSQIAPSRHRALQFGVVNVGLIKARIGSGEAPQIWVETELLTPQQIQTSEGNLISEDEIALLRDLAERKRIRQAVSSEDAEPVITLTDGPLDIFYRSTIQGEREQQVQRDISEIDEDLRRRGVLTAGYIDKHGSAMLSRMLAVFQCKRQGLPPDKKTDGLNLSDRFILRDILDQPGERSAIFEAISRGPKKPANSGAVAFFYLNVSGAEDEPCLVRVEFPLWVSESPRLVDALHAVIYREAQVLDSHPYPYLLHRAHELAVVRRIEADEVEAMLQSQLDPQFRARQRQSNKSYLKGLS